MPYIKSLPHSLALFALHPKTWKISKLCSCSFNQLICLLPKFPFLLATIHSIVLYSILSLLSTFIAEQYSLNKYLFDINDNSFFFFFLVLFLPIFLFCYCLDCSVCPGLFILEIRNEQSFEGSNRQTKDTTRWWKIHA